MRLPVNLNSVSIQAPVLMCAFRYFLGALIILVQLQEWQGIKQVPIRYHRNYDENDAKRMKKAYKIIKKMACTETSQVVYSLVKGQDKGIVILFGVWLDQS
jgi:hypothetical protein